MHIFVVVNNGNNPQKYFEWMKKKYFEWMNVVTNSNTYYGFVNWKEKPSEKLIFLISENIREQALHRELNWCEVTKNGWVDTLD